MVEHGAARVSFEPTLNENALYTPAAVAAAAANLRYVVVGTRVVAPPTAGVAAGQDALAVEKQLNAAVAESAPGLGHQ